MSNVKAGSPEEFLQRIQKSQVKVKLNPLPISHDSADEVDASEFQGKLLCLDGYMNVALENAKEFDHFGKSVDVHDNAFIRGNNGISNNYDCLISSDVYSFVKIYKLESRSITHFGISIMSELHVSSSIIP